MLPDLKSYDVILINTSAGKDSQAMMDHLVRLATQEGCFDRLLAVHCDLGRIEWAGTRALAERQAKAYGLPFYAMRREKGDLLANVLQKHASVVARDKRDKSGRLQVAWPDPGNRWCTSEHKTQQVGRLMTWLVDNECERLWGRRFGRGSSMPRKIRILTCLGLRSEESDTRRKRIEEATARFGFAFIPGTAQSNGKRLVDEWYPIADWTLEQVWDCIRASGVEHHPAYDFAPGDRRGMSRLSCCFCVMASKRDLVIAAQRNPDLALDYLRVEEQTGKRWTHGRSMADLIKLAASPDAAAIVQGPDSEQGDDCEAF